MAKGKKYRMGDFKLDGNKYTCSRGRLWPPIEVTVYSQSPDELRQRVSTARYAEMKVWESACGLTKMDSEKCPLCPYVEINGELATKPGIQRKIHTTKATQVVQNRKAKRDRQQK